jgi:DNA modification methylase
MKINKIYNEDCLDTMSCMPNCCIDLVVTSPPYDNLREYNGYIFYFEDIAKALYRVIKNGGVVVWVVGDSTKKGTESLTAFKQALFFKKIGFNIHDTMIYAKNNYMPLNHNRYDQQFEYMFILSKGKPKTFNPIRISTLTCGRRNSLYKKKGISEPVYAVRSRHALTVVKPEKLKSNIWFYNVGHNDHTSHPAPFPEKLVEDHILSWSNSGDLIYDPFMGSGTTAKMSFLLNRNYIGSEISSKYCAEIDKRMRNTYNKLLIEKVKSISINIVLNLRDL